MANKCFTSFFTFVYKGSTKADADELQLHDAKTYFTTVWATNVLGYTRVLRSDGVTVQVEPLLPGLVRDGPITGFDLMFQPSLSELSANWDGFGNERTNVIEIKGKVFDKFLINFT